MQIIRTRDYSEDADRTDVDLSPASYEVGVRPTQEGTVRILPPVANAASIRILVVDESPVTRKCVKDSLRREHVEIVCVNGAAAARATLRARTIDILLVDISVPFIGGTRLLEDLNRADDHVCAVAMTSASKPISAAMMRELGVVASVQKPCTGSELKENLVPVIRAVQGSPAGAHLGPSATVCESVARPVEQRTEEQLPAPDASSASVDLESILAEHGRCAALRANRPSDLLEIPCDPRHFMDSNMVLAEMELPPGDILLLDSAERGVRTLQQLLPDAVRLTGCTTAEEGLTLVRHKRFQVILVDAAVSPMGGDLFVELLRLMQPQARIVALTIGGRNAEPLPAGVAGVMMKPFREDEVDRLVAYLGYRRRNRHNNVLTAEPMLLETGSVSTLERVRLTRAFFARTARRLKVDMERLAKNYEQTVLLDLTEIPPSVGSRSAGGIAKLVRSLAIHADLLQVDLRCVVSDQTASELVREKAELRHVRLFASLDDAANAVAVTRKTGVDEARNRVPRSGNQPI